MRNKNFCRNTKEIGKKQSVSFRLLTNCAIFAERIDIEKHYGRNNQESIYQARPKRFIRFNYELYKHNSYSVPDLYDDMLNTFNKRKNPAFEFCEADHFLAYKDGQVEFKIYIPDLIPEKHKRISEFVKCKYNLQIKKYTSGKAIPAITDKPFSGSSTKPLWPSAAIRPCRNGRQTNRNQIR